MSTIKPGFTVKLKTNDRLMTVIKIESDGNIECRWFEREALKQDVFRPEDLTVVESCGHGRVIVGD
jgi:uncharacterized protein YodC (DUF2158 family)